MKNESEFAYIEKNDKIEYLPMIASNAVAVAPQIYDGITYLPFRYVFEEILGFSDATGKKKHLIIKNICGAIHRLLIYLLM